MKNFILTLTVILFGLSASSQTIFIDSQYTSFNDELSGLQSDTAIVKVDNDTMLIKQFYVVGCKEVPMHNLNSYALRVIKYLRVRRDDWRLLSHKVLYQN